MFILSKIDEEVTALVVFIVFTALFKNIWFSLAIAGAAYFVVWAYVPNIVEEPVEEVKKEEPPKIVEIPRKIEPKFGEVLINDSFILNLLANSIFISGLKGFGKSVLLYKILLEIHKRYNPEQIQVVIIDMKETGFTPFANSPFVVNNKIYTDVLGVEVVEKMFASRKEEYLKCGEGYIVGSLAKYHRVKKPEQPNLPHIIVIVDELQLLEDDIIRISKVNKVSRSQGITFICATQRGVAEIPPKMLSQFDERCVTYNTNTAEYRYCGIKDDDTIKLMSKKEGLFAIGSESRGFVVTQVDFISEEEVEELALTFPPKTVQLKTSSIMNNTLCLSWFAELDKKPTLIEIKEHFLCDTAQAVKFSKLWSKQ